MFLSRLPSFAAQRKKCSILCLVCLASTDLQMSQDVSVRERFASCNAMLPKTIKIP